VQHILLLCTRSFLYSSAQAIASRLVILHRVRIEVTNTNMFIYRETQ